MVHHPKIPDIMVVEEADEFSLGFTEAEVVVSVKTDVPWLSNVTDSRIQTSCLKANLLRRIFGTVVTDQYL